MVISWINVVPINITAFNFLRVIFLQEKQKPQVSPIDIPIDILIDIPKI